jgi:hypothetical protein
VTIRFVLKEWDIGCVEGRGDYKVCALEIWVQEGGDKGCVQGCSDRRVLEWSMVVFKEYVRKDVICARSGT